VAYTLRQGFYIENWQVPTVSKSLQASLEIASATTFSNATLDVRCQAAARTRPFDLAVNNCQRFCTHILQRLVNNAIISQERFDALRTKWMSAALLRSGVTWGLESIVYTRLGILKKV
jgi:hypothetical protein